MVYCLLYFIQLFGMLVIFYWLFGMLFSAFLWFQFGSTRWAKLLMDFWWDGWRLRRCVRLRCRTNVTALAGFSATTRMISATAGPFYKLRRKFFVSFLCDWWCCVDGLMLCRRFEVCVGWTYGDDADDFVTLSKTNTEYVMQDTTEVEQHGVPWMEQHGVPFWNSTEYHDGTARSTMMEQHGVPWWNSTE